MKPSGACLSLIKRYEGCRLEAYRDTGGVWTIGWGYTGPEVTPGCRISQLWANMLLERSVAAVADQVDEAAVGITMTQGQFDALVSFVYNIGITEFLKSTLLTKLRAGDTIGVADEFPRWIHDNAAVLSGLITRRAEERAMFLRR